MLRRFSKYARKKLVSIYYFYDDFIGSNFDDRAWYTRGSTGGSVTSVFGGVVRIRTGAVNNRYEELYNNDLGDSAVAQCGRCTWRFSISATTSIIAEIGFKAASPDAGTACIRFYYEAAKGANWYAQTMAASTTTETDTGKAANTSYHEIVIETFADPKVNFYFDGALVATHTTNVTDKLLQLFAKVTTETGSARDINVDFVELSGNRES